MLSDPKEVSRVSQNLSLRLSPERKYSPKNVCPKCCCSPCICSKICCCPCCCSPSRNPCCCCCCCCCCDPCCLNYDDNSLNSPNELNSKNNIGGNSSMGMGSTKYQTGAGPQRQNTYNNYDQNNLTIF